MWTPQVMALLFVVRIILVFVTVKFAGGQLVVNVKNKGGEVLQETIQSNTSLDTIRLDFQEYDGTLITQFIDFKNVSGLCVPSSTLHFQYACVDILIRGHNSYIIS